MSSSTCNQCGKAADEQRYGEWRGQPAGWLVKQDWCCSELMSERTVCSAACADALDAREEAEREAEAKEYAERKARGELTLMEVLDEQMATTLARLAAASTLRRYDALERLRFGDE